MWIVTVQYLHQAGIDWIKRLSIRTRNCVDIAVIEQSPQPYYSQSKLNLTVFSHLPIFFSAPSWSILINCFDSA